MKVGFGGGSGVVSGGGGWCGSGSGVTSGGGAVAARWRFGGGRRVRGGGIIDRGLFFFSFLIGVAAVAWVFIVSGLIESNKLTRSLGNNAAARVTLADGRPLKSSLKKPRDSSNATGTPTTADLNTSCWFEVRSDPEGGNVSNEKGSNGKVNMKNNKVEVNKRFRSFVNEEQVLEHGPWMIRNSPIILSKWSSYVSMTCKEVTKVPVWIKLRKIPFVAYYVDRLSLIAIQVGKPIMLDAFTSSRCNESWDPISYARALVEIGVGTDLKIEVVWLSQMRTRMGTREVISAYHSDGFTEVKRKKKKGRKVYQMPKEINSGSDGPKPNAFRFNKPQPNNYRPKQASQAAQGKSDALKPNSNPFDALNTFNEEDINGSQKSISCKGVKDPNIGVSSSVKKKLAFSPQPKIHYFDSDDTDDANMDVRDKCGAFRSMDTQNEDLEFDEDVDEQIFPEGDKFDIRLKGRSRQ
nr:hypothetical protein [Tanacetum cinerariifolium]